MVDTRLELPWYFVARHSNEHEFDCWWRHHKTGWKSRIKNRVKKKSNDIVLHYYTCSLKSDGDCGHKVTATEKPDGQILVETTLVGENLHETLSLRHNQQHQHQLMVAPQLVAARQQQLSISSMIVQQLEAIYLRGITVRDVRKWGRRYTFLERLTSDSDLLVRTAAYEFFKYAAAKSVEPALGNVAFLVERDLFVNNLLIWTTKRLKGLQNKESVLIVDTIIVPDCDAIKFLTAGTLDGFGEYQPTYLALSLLSTFDPKITYLQFFKILSGRNAYKPRIILSLGLPEIKKAAELVFPGTTCLSPYDFYNSAVMSLDMLNGISIEDISILFYAISTEQFQKVAPLMIQKRSADRRFTTMKKEWLQPTNFRWVWRSKPFDGFMKMFAHKTSDHSITSFQNMPFSKITKMAEKMLRAEWCAKNRRSNAPLKVLPTNNNNRFIFASKFHENLTDHEMVETAELICGTDFNSFDHYKENRFKVYVVNKIGDQLYQCTCKAGFFSIVCCHIKYLQADSEASGSGAS